MLEKREKIIYQIERLSKTLCKNEGLSTTDKNIVLTNVLEKIDKLVFDLKNVNIMIEAMENVDYDLKA
jgi:hypothetical protein